ncbi:LacI family DNA-binding transcriptional regulator [Azospirillum brasilense]|uniref:LacI family DNA-binding transcriptional regulator n=1 Tax=Azospirillum brasilense TaxID=192 RepID=UPI0020004F97|nr:LacI family DNA-binding transcriptional regulator [Azospirillum brasilense]
MQDDADAVAAPLEHSPEHSRGLPRIADIARLSGVSTATVDRVLNHRPGVRPATVQRVMKAAAELDYIPESDLGAALGPKPVRLAFLLPDGTNRYLTRLGQLIRQSEAALAPLGIRAQVEFIKSFNPDLLARSLLQHWRKVDGVAFMALEHPAVREAVNELAARNVPTVTLISDVQNCRRAAQLGAAKPAGGRNAGPPFSRLLGGRVGTGESFTSTTRCRASDGSADGVQECS